MHYVSICVILYLHFKEMPWSNPSCCEVEPRKTELGRREQKICRLLRRVIKRNWPKRASIVMLFSVVCSCLWRSKSLHCHSCAPNGRGMTGVASSKNVSKMPPFRDRSEPAWPPSAWTSLDK